MEKNLVQKNDEIGLRTYLRELSTRDLEKLAFYMSNRYGKSMVTWKDLLTGYRTMTNKCEVECLINVINEQLWNKSV